MHNIHKYTYTFIYTHTYVHTHIYTRFSSLGDTVENTNMNRLLKLLPFLLAASESRTKGNIIFHYNKMFTYFLLPEIRESFLNLGIKYTRVGQFTIALSNFRGK